MLTLIRNNRERKKARAINHCERLTINTGKSLDQLFELSPEEAVLQIESMYKYLQEKKEAFIQKALNENPELFQFI
jgi:hypothetical protein